MPNSSHFTKVSASPTNPSKGSARSQQAFDVASLYEGPINLDKPSARNQLPLDEKLRQAYFWIVNKAIISPFYDIEYNEAPGNAYTLGDCKTRVVLPTAQSYSSFVLLPLLTFAAQRKCLMIGGPGRGKTASAILMAILAGYTPKEVKRGIQKGQPQMSITDLLGSPLPSALMQADEFSSIKIAWRSWLGMRVKIIDEYNRIPTRTQSALLTVMADNYAEIYDQVYECPDAAWFLTANDDAGGGTYEVIEALKDRIDVVVKAFHFNTRFLRELLLRIENGFQPEELVPSELIFSEEDTARMKAEIRAVPIPENLMRRFEFFASQFEHCEQASKQIEYQTKDTVKLADGNFHQVFRDDSGLDLEAVFGTQTQNGLSVRTFMTAITYVKAMAFFRGGDEVSLEDFRQMLPFVLHDKLTQYKAHKIFSNPNCEAFKYDRVTWIRNLFDRSNQEFDRLGRHRTDVVQDLLLQLDESLEGVSEQETESRLAKIETILADYAAKKKMYPHMHDDILTLKYLHQRYTNYLTWLRWQA